jgi:ABC-type glycerol-3-phosphate transport system substrate-binding protein
MIVLFSTLLTLGVAGCTPPAPSENAVAKPFAGKTIRVACPSGPPAAIVRTYSRAWSSSEGCTVEVVEYDATDAEPAHSADVWVVAPAALPKKAAAGLVRELPPSITGLDSSFGWMDILPIYRERLLQWDHKRIAVPLMGEAPLCIYRSDLLADPGRAEAFQKKFGRKPTPPATWDEFADLAEHFRDTTPGGPAPSLAPLSATDAGLDREFFTIVACYARQSMAPDEPLRPDKQDQLFSFQYDHRTGKPRLTAKGFEYALNLLKRLQKCRQPGTAFELADAFKDGNAAMGLANVGVLAKLQQVPALRDKFGVCRMPGGASWFEYATGKQVASPAGNRVPYLGSGGWLAAVPLGSGEPDAAFGLLADLAGRERSGQIVIDPKWGGGPTRRDQLDRTRWDAFGLDPQRTKDLKDALKDTLQHPGVQNPAVRLRTSTEATHTAALMKEVRSFLTSDGADAAKALAAASDRWEQMDKERGVEEARADYLISVGLIAPTAK